MPGTLRNAGVGWVLGTSLACACAQGGGIFTCVDAKGRRLTSDRPIQECIDREQKELNQSGTVRRTIGPSLTAQERAAKEAQERKLAEEEQRVAEERRRERAMLARYPNQAAHDAERASALNAVHEAILAGNKRIADLREQRRKLMLEAEFYASDPKKMPAKLRRDLDDVDRNIASQQRVVANQEEEKGRVNRRFDEELAKLRGLWAQLQPAQAAASAPARR